jgi:hypothetical protein
MRRVAERQIDLSCDEAALGKAREALDASLDPVGSGNAIGVGESENVSARDVEPAIPRGVGARPGLAHELCAREPRDERPWILTRAVVDDDHLVPVGGIRLAL